MRRHRQSLIGNYFKSKANTPIIPKTMSDTDKTVKKRKLSLNKPITPTKCPKTEEANNVSHQGDNEEIVVSTQNIQVIDLIDDGNESASDSSVLTEVYSLSPIIKKTSSAGQTPDNISYSRRLQFENSDDSYNSPFEASMKSEDTDFSLIPIKVERDNPKLEQNLQNIEDFVEIAILNTNGSSVVTSKETEIINGTQIKSEKTPEKACENNFLSNTSVTPVMSKETENINRTPIKSEKTPEKTLENFSLSNTSGKQVISKTTEIINGTPIITEKTPVKTFGNFASTSTETPKLMILGPSQESAKPNGTPIKFENNGSSQNTPQKTPQKALRSQGSFQSPTREKFYSPTKKRSVVKRTPTKGKRSLSMDMIVSSELQQMFTHACEGMDDKSIFLLTIIKRYLSNDAIKHLLDAKCQELLTSCLRVTKPGMRLVCRLYWRKLGWYKLDQVRQISFEKEKEPCNDPMLREMIMSLVQCQLIEEGDISNMTFDDYKTILSRPELMQICKDLKLKMATKQDAIDALLSFSKRSSNISRFIIGCTSNNSKIVLQKMSAKAGPCYRLTDLARSTLDKLYILMYLGMDYTKLREKKLELTLLLDKIGRETYPVDKDMVLDNASCVFRSREDFERYVSAYEIYEDLESKTDLAEKCEAIKTVYNMYKDIGHNEMTYYQNLPLWLRKYTPANVYIKILENSIQDLKKGEHCLLALQVSSTLIEQTAFRQHKKADWYAAKALILHSLNRYDEAAEVLLEGFKSDLTEEEKDSMRARARKIAKQKNIVIADHLRAELLAFATKDNIMEKNLTGEHITKQPMDRTNPRGKVKFETRTDGGRVVQDAEEYCIMHYICTGKYTHGEHWEGRIVTSIFNLLFWDIIYSKPNAPGIFLCYYQTWPLDMFCGDTFYMNRKDTIDAWLEAIEKFSESKLLAVMEETWNSRPESELSGISRAIGWDKIKIVTSCLGARAVAAICRRLATNYRYSHSGFPDLTLWNCHTKEIKFVEVKTDTDKPSIKQIQWMMYLREHGVDTEFCYLGANTTRQRCRNTKEPVKTD